MMMMKMIINTTLNSSCIISSDLYLFLSVTWYEFDCESKLRRYCRSAMSELSHCSLKLYDELTCWIHWWHTWAGKLSPANICNEQQWQLANISLNIMAPLCVFCKHHYNTAHKSHPCCHGYQCCCVLCKVCNQAIQTADCWHSCQVYRCILWQVHAEAEGTVENWTYKTIYQTNGIFSTSDFNTFTELLMITQSHN